MGESRQAYDRLVRDGPDLHPQQEYDEEGKPLYTYWDREVGTRPWPNIRDTLPPGWRQARTLALAGPTALSRIALVSSSRRTIRIAAGAGACAHCIAAASGPATRRTRAEAVPAVCARAHIGHVVLTLSAPHSPGRD